MGEPSSGALSPVRSPNDRLDSWKEIAGYLQRDVKTVQRWEKREEMPVHRHLHEKVGSVYAFSSELEAWLQRRRLRLEQDEKEGTAEPPLEAAPGYETRGHLRSPAWVALVAVAVYLPCSP